MLRGLLNRPGVAETTDSEAARPDEIDDERTVGLVWYAYYQLVYVADLLAKPGVVVHELAHQIVIEFFDYEVIDVDYFSHVEHEMPRTFTHAVLVAYAPVIVNTVLAVALLFGAFREMPIPIDHISLSAQTGIALYLAFALFFNALPSLEDVETVFALAKLRFKWYRVFVILGFLLIAPIVAPSYLILWVTRRFGTRSLVDFAFTAVAFLSVFGLLPWWEAVPVVLDWVVAQGQALLDWWFGSGAV